MATEKILLRQTLEKVLYEYVINEDNNVKEDDDLPSASKLRRAVVNSGEYVRYIEARKFILAKVDAGQFTVEAIKAGQGKIVKNDNPPQPEPEEEEKTDESEPAKSNNLLEQAVKEATEETVKEAQKKAEEERKKKEEATPSQEEQVGPVTVKDDAFDNIQVTEEEINKKKKEKEEAKEEVTYVTRKEIRSMSDEEVDRFFNAVDTLMKAKDGPGSSEFFRLAVKYHIFDLILC